MGYFVVVVSSVHDSSCFPAAVAVWEMGLGRFHCSFPFLLQMMGLRAAL